MKSLKVFYAFNIFAGFFLFLLFWLSAFWKESPQSSRCRWVKFQWRWFHSYIMSFLNLISIGEQLATISGAKSCVETMSFPGSLSPRAVGVLARHSRQDTRLMNDRQLINEIYFLLTSCETQGSKGVAILPCFLLIVAPIRDRFLSPREVNTTSEVWSGLRGPDPGGGEQLVRAPSIWTLKDTTLEQISDMAAIFNFFFLRVERIRWRLKLVMFRPVQMRANGDLHSLLSAGRRLSPTVLYGTLPSSLPPGEEQKGYLLTWTNPDFFRPVSVSVSTCYC